MQNTMTLHRGDGFLLAMIWGLCLAATQLPGVLAFALGVLAAGLWRRLRAMSPVQRRFGRMAAIAAFVLLKLLLFPDGLAAQPTFQACSAIAPSTGADVTVTLPAHATNDILVLMGTVRDVDDTVTVSGWTQITGSPWDRSTTERYWVFWKRAASGAETNPLFDKSTATGDTYATVCTYRNAITSGNPFEVTGSTATGTADPASCTAITTSSANALVVVPLAYADDNNAAITTTGTDPAAYTEHYTESATGSDGSVTFSEAVRTTAGGTGTISVNFDTAVTAGDGWGCVALAMTSAPPPAGNMKSLPLTGVGLRPHR